MKNILGKTKFVKCKRQLPNLKSYLIKSEFRESTLLPKVSRCQDTRCGLCGYIIEGNHFTTKSNKTFYV